MSINQILAWLTVQINVVLAQLTVLYVGHEYIAFRSFFINWANSWLWRENVANN